MKAVNKNKADAILLSGGLDTSILAFMAKPKVAFTAALKDSQALDPLYAEKVSTSLRMEHKKKEFTVAEALNILPEVIRILKTFDLALPNDLSIYFALRLAKENNVHSVLTGDGSDELFAGYSYMTKLSSKHLDRYIRELSQNWHFSSIDIGKALGIKVKQPFLDDDFVRFALDISSELKVKEGIGKYILRKSFENLIPAEIIWREKEPIEYGSGSNMLHKIISDMVPEEEFQLAKKRTGIAFINKEHCFYYHIYNEVVGEIPQARGNEIKCPCCGASMGKYHCRTCGYSQPLSHS